jgi:hypothetical protein
MAWRIFREIPIFHSISQISNSVVRPFISVPVQTPLTLIFRTEEESEWRGESSQVGTINVRIIWTRHTKTPFTNSRPTLKLENGAVHEKTKKLATHRVLCGDPGE